MQQPPDPEPTRSAPYAETLVYPFRVKIEPGRVRGKVSPFREAGLTITPAGLRIEGKALMALWKRVLFTCLGLLLLYGALVVAVVVNHLIRFPAQLELCWDLIDEVVLEPRKNRACLVYRLPDEPQTVHSLAFYLPPAQLQYFSEVVRYWAGPRVREGKIGPPESPWVGIGILIFFLLLMVVVLVFVVRAPS